MDSQRNVLIIALIFMSFIIWQTWEQEKKLNFWQQSVQTNAIANGIKQDSFLNQKTLINNQGKKIIVKTDVLELTINTLGGDIERALLLHYPKQLNSNEPFKLLETMPEFIYQAQSGLAGRDGPDSQKHGLRPVYYTDKEKFFLIGNQQELIVPMSCTDIAGNIFIKTFTLKRGKYDIDISYNIYNTGTKQLELSSFGQLKQSINFPLNGKFKTDSFALHTFRGAAYSTSDEKYRKYKFSTITNNNNLNINSKGGWIAMLQQYFATAWIPHSTEKNNFYTANLNKEIVVIGYKSQPVLVQPGQNRILKDTLWIGPKIQDEMAAVATHLDLAVDYGWLWFIAQPLFKLLKFIYNFLGNWGFSIIVITFIVRGVMYQLTKAQYISMAKMRILQPKIQAIRERLGDDKQRISQEMLALYKKEKVNPLGGCFSLLIQMPIFLSLYYMLTESVELRHAPLALWIKDLSAQDPYYTLPIFMGITMYLIQNKSPLTNVTDPIQHKLITFMPIIFTVFFLWFPSGLVLYYTISNLVTIIQQQLIYRSLVRHGLHSNK